MRERAWPVWTFRILFAVDLACVVVSFIPSYFGTLQSAGIADKLFPNHSGGFRGDVDWIALSGLALIAGSVFAILRWACDKSRSNSVDAILGIVWVVAYVAYIRHVLGGLWMG
jgi:hypothetical protein